jgi:hypothetical protein
MHAQSFERCLLVACCEHILGYDKREVLKSLLHQPINETLLFQFCETHRLFFVLYQAWIVPFKAQLPASLVSQITQHVLMLKGKQLYLERMLIAIHQLFVKHDIAHVFLKGPVLNWMLFSGNELRYSNDIDVLVLPKQVLEADALLKTLGFLPRIPISTVKQDLNWRWLSRRKDVIYERPSTPFTIELHWKTHAIELLFTQPDIWVKNRLFYPYHGHLMPMLSHEYHCLYLCCHAIKHEWERLRWLLDIVAYFQKQLVDLPTFFKLAHQHRLMNAVLETFLMIQHVFGIDYLKYFPIKPSLQVVNAIEKACLYRTSSTLKVDTYVKRLRRFYYLNLFCTRLSYHVRFWSMIVSNTVKNRVRKKR